MFVREYIFIMKIFRVAVAMILTASVVFSAFFGLKMIGVKPDAVERTEYKGIVTLWQIDSFEGGRGSRRQFLLDAAVGFEKINEGVLVMVISHTKASAESDFEKGIYPDLISFGGGTEVKNAVAFNAERSFKGGDVGDKTYFTPWCRGGYVLISNPKLAEYSGGNIEKLLVSQAEYTQPLIALKEQGITSAEIEILSPMDAYVKFTGGKIPYMLGTQRDVVRLISRGMDFTATPFTEYNDLYQYIGITSTDTVKALYAEKFVNYLLSDAVQSKLFKISMFSQFIEVPFDDASLSEMQSVSAKKTISAFMSAIELKNLQSLAVAALKGDEQSQIKIKNVLY